MTLLLHPRQILPAPGRIRLVRVFRLAGCIPVL